MVKIQHKSKEEISKYLANFMLITDTNSSIKQNTELSTKVDYITVDTNEIPRFINEFWTSKQRQASSIHEISYRACFKAELPRFFITLLTNPGDVVYDPFSGRGTTVIEAGMLGREIISNDVNPLSDILTVPRFKIPKIDEIEKRFSEIELTTKKCAKLDLSMFYHPNTESEIVSLKSYLAKKRNSGKEDSIDKWIRMVATNRLTGHSKGFFSVYTLPPNQAVSPERQKKINAKRNQKPEYRNVSNLIIKKSKSLTRNLKKIEKENLAKASKNAQFLSLDARETSPIKSNSVDLTITSPPFLDVVQYSKDNWLRCWFNEIDISEVEKKISVTKRIEDWSSIMQSVFNELFRITKKGGYLAFEVGEIRKGKINLDEYVVPLGIASGFCIIGIIINLQKFTKTANIWGVDNNSFGTNTNRIVLFKKLNI